MKVTVLGCGALGQLWMTALFKKGHEIQGWLRLPKPYCIVNLIEKNGRIFNGFFMANNLEFLEKSDVLFVTLKAWQVSDAVKKLARFLPKTSPILLMHNGMGIIDELKMISHPLLMATTTHAVRRDGNVMVHVSSGLTNIGQVREEDGDYRYLAEILQQALPNVVWHDYIFPQLWKKLAVNCVINPLTVLWNCPNGELKYHPKEVSSLCRELALLFEIERLQISESEIQYYIEEIIDTTSENISSMLQDIRTQRYTEIDYITGFLLMRARMHGLSLPNNARLYEIVKLNESRHKFLITSASPF